MRTDLRSETSGERSSARPPVPARTARRSRRGVVPPSRLPSRSSSPRADLGPSWQSAFAAKPVRYRHPRLAAVRGPRCVCATGARLGRLDDDLSRARLLAAAHREVSHPDAPPATWRGLAGERCLVCLDRDSRCFAAPPLAAGITWLPAARGAHDGRGLAGPPAGRQRRSRRLPHAFTPRRQVAPVRRPPGTSLAILAVGGLGLRRRPAGCAVEAVRNPGAVVRRRKVLPKQRARASRRPPRRMLLGLGRSADSPAKLKAWVRGLAGATTGLRSVSGGDRPVERLGSCAKLRRPRGRRAPARRAATSSDVVDRRPSPRRRRPEVRGAGTRHAHARRRVRTRFAKTLEPSRSVNGPRGHPGGRRSAHEARRPRALRSRRDGRPPRRRSSAERLRGATIRARDPHEPASGPDGERARPRAYDRLVGALDFSSHSASCAPLTSAACAPACSPRRG